MPAHEILVLYALKRTYIGLSRVYSDRQLNSDSDLVCFIFQILEKNKLTKQTVKILMRRLIWSRLIGIYTVCKYVSELT